MRQCLLQSPVLKHHSCQKHRSGEHWYVPCTECSSTSTVSQKFHLYCVHCCPGLRASHDFVNATHNTARQQLSQKWDCHLWKTKHERKMRKSTAHSFQTVKPQFQNCDGLKASVFLDSNSSFRWLYTGHLGWNCLTFPLCLAIRQAWQRPHMPKRGRRKEFKQVLGKCSVSGSRMKSFVKNTLVYQSTPPLHRPQTAHPEVGEDKIQNVKQKVEPEHGEAWHLVMNSTRNWKEWNYQTIFQTQLLGGFIQSLGDI